MAKKRGTQAPAQPPDPAYTDIGFKENYWAKVKPDVAWAEIQRIKAARRLPNDELPGPDILIQESLDPERPLHAVFEWDDSKAAHQHRLSQARKLLRSITAWVRTKEHYEPVRVTAVINVVDPQRGHQGYYEAKAVARSPKQSLLYQATLLKQIRSWLHKYAEWSKLTVLFTGFIAQIDVLQAEIDAEIAAIQDPLGSTDGEPNVA
jgi:hypothetical protein